MVEDAAHATEAHSCGRVMGTIAPLTASSSCTAQNLENGDGGMLTPENAARAEEIPAKNHLRGGFAQ